MRIILLACIAIGAAVAPLIPAAQAQVVVQLPGIAIQSGDPYWRQHQEGEWRRRQEFREAEHRHRGWQREHCVRDWRGNEFCR
jgi:hypothetical protein